MIMRKFDQGAAKWREDVSVLLCEICKCVLLFMNIQEKGEWLQVNNRNDCSFCLDLRSERGWAEHRHSWTEMVSVAVARYIYIYIYIYILQMF